MALPLALAPCWWQPHIPSADLASHLYNTWLVSLIQHGQAPGLMIARQFTNVLFDLILGAIDQLFGMWAAEHVATTLAVCVFISGAFAFVSETAGRRWHTLPAIVAVAYGFVFHMGFFNFYLSLGLCFWAMALCWNPTPRRIAAAIPIFALATLAHALAVGWALAALLFRFLAPRVGERRLAIAAVVSMVIGRVILGRITETIWLDIQLWRTTGLDQLWVFDTKYGLAAAGLAALWIWWAAKTHESPGAAASRSTVAYVTALTAIGILIMPIMIQLPGYKHEIAFISDRMSLAVAVCACAWLAPAAPGKWTWPAGLALLVVFFGFLLRDHAALNDLEDSIGRGVAQVPAGQRAVAPFDAPALRVDPLWHFVDRLCIGSCFSYGNYEPASAQFRVRVTGENPIVVSGYKDSSDIETGQYVVKPRDLPLYLIAPSPEGGFGAVSVPAGSKPAMTHLNPL